MMYTRNIREYNSTSRNINKNLLGDDILSIDDFFRKVVSPFEKKTFSSNWKSSTFGLPAKSKNVIMGLAYDVFFNKKDNLLFCTLYLGDKENEKLINSLSERQISLIKDYWDKDKPVVIYSDDKYISTLENNERIDLFPISLKEFKAFCE